MATDKDSSGGFVHECFYGCNSAEHASHLSAVLTKDNLPDEKVAAYLKWYCTKYARGVDSSGRNLLHLAASKGRLKLMMFLLAHREININGKDRESLYTALHRSVFYGQLHCAVRLIESGANIQQNDGEDLTPLDHIMKDRPNILTYNNSQICEVYVWGTNTNYNLGIGHHHSRSNIEPLDMFRKENISIKQVLMSKFHSLFIGSNGKVWACGLGSGGRLGLGDENTTLVPKILKIGNSSTDCCKAASIGVDHSILLMENGTVWSFGLNNYYQLGHSPPPDKVLSPKIIKSLKELNIIGISASKFHSVFWTKNQVFTCGLNGGQLGHLNTNENKIDTPKLVTSLKLNSNTTIKHVTSSDGATVIVTDRGDIFLFREYLCKRITTKFNRMSIKKICVLGGHLDHKVLTSYLEESGGDDLKILLVTNKDTIYLWQETCQQMIRCLLSIRRDVVITDIVLNRAVVIITTQDGEAFEGEIKSKKRKINLEDEKSPPLKTKVNKFLAKEDCDYIKIKKIPHIHRAVNAASDLKGRNFAVVQVHPKAGLLKIPSVESTEMIENMKMFLDNTNEFDTLHDVVFQVDGTTFPAHRYIVSHSCKVLEEIINKAELIDGVYFVRIENVQAQIFKRILSYLYTGECDLLKTGNCPVVLNSVDSNLTKVIEQIKDPEEYIIDESNISAYEHYKRQRPNKKKKDLKLKSDVNNPLKALRDAAKIFDLTSLVKILETLRYDNGYICTLKGKNVECSPPKFSRKNFQNLWDINLKAEDGTIIKAHKCILTARLEYFNCMINQGWLEASLKTPLKLPIPSTVLEILIRYLYTDEAPEIVDTYDIDLASHILVIADQYFCTRLKEMAEVSLSHIINLKNAAEMLQLSVTYNASQLKQTSMEFICLNLSALLESRSLEILDDELLTELRDFYRSWLPCLTSRIITPDSSAPNDELVESVYNSEPVSLDKVEEEPLIIKMKNQSSKTPKKKSSKERKNSDSERKRNASVGSTTSEEELMNSYNNEIENDSWIMVTNHGLKQQMKAQTKAKEIQNVDSFKMEPSKNTNVKIPLIPIPKSNPINVTRVSLREKKNSCSEFDTENSFLSTSSDKEFPALSASAPERTITVTSPKSPSATNKKFVKLSQKQRKKLAKQSISEDEETNTKPQETTTSVWGVPKYEISAMADIMKEEMKASHLGAPWPGPSSPASLSAIMAAERHQRDLLMKMKSKSLEYTQMEDKAIDDLNILYDISNVTDERITVRRADSIIFSPPVWVSGGHR